MHKHIEAADFTVFLQGDPISHWKQFQWSYFNTIIKSISAGRMADNEEKGLFMHLSTPRLVAVKNPCHDQVYQYVHGALPPEGKLFSVLTGRGAAA